jgi:hypothetical protein
VITRTQEYQRVYRRLRKKHLGRCPCGRPKTTVSDLCLRCDRRNQWPKRYGEKEDFIELVLNGTQVEALAKKFGETKQRISQKINRLNLRTVLGVKATPPWRNSNATWTETHN